MIQELTSNLNNYLSKNTRSYWSIEEDIKLLENYIQVGRKWSVISKTFGNRTENSVKNRWKSLITKFSAEFKKYYPSVSIPSTSTKKSDE